MSGLSIQNTQVYQPIINPINEVKRDFSVEFQRAYTESEDPILSNNNFSPELANPECDLPGLYHFQAEILRTGWILGSVISYNLRDSIGNAFLNNSWQEHPFFGSLQTSFNTLSRKATQLASCSSKPIFLAAQKGWQALKHSLKKEEVPSNLRDLLALNSDRLGVFSETPLIISDNGPSLPNVVTKKEFNQLQEVYTAIEQGNGPITIDPALLVELRILLSTKVGRDLIYALYKQPEPLSIELSIERSEYLPGLFSAEKVVVSTSENDKKSKCFFGAPNSDKVKVSDTKYATLFHELTHAYHSLVTRDIGAYSYSNNLNFNPWSNQEEERTILKTNEFLRQLKLGEEDWYGRWGHICDGITERRNLDDFFRYKVRLDDQKNTIDTTQELYDDHPIIGELLAVCPNINDHLISASSLDNTNWLYTILNSTRALEISSENLGRALEKMASAGHKGMIEAFLNSKRALEISSEDLSNALYMASSHGHKEVVQTFLNSKRAPEISPKDLVHAFQKASSDGHKEVVQTFLNSKRALEISSKDLVHAFKEASFHGHKEVVRTFLNSKRALEISSKNLSHAFKEAYFHGYVGMIEVFLNSKKSLEITSQAALDDALQDVLKTFLNPKRALEISSEDLGKALYVASYNAHHDVFKAILNSKRALEISSEDLGSTLKDMGFRRDKGMIEVFLNSKIALEISSEDLGQTLEEAFEQEEVVLTFLNSKIALKISSQTLDLALKKASLHGHENVVKTILNSKSALKISSQALDQALENASSRGNKEVIETILNSKSALKISSQALDQALETAYSRGNKEVTETILNSKIALELTPESLDQALEEASSHKSKDLIETILNSKIALKISSQAFAQALETASYYGHKDVVETILNSKRALEIPSESLDQALEKASSHRSKDVIETILNSKIALKISSQALDRALPLISKNEKIVQKIFDKLSWTKKVQYRLGLI